MANTEETSRFLLGFYIVNAIWKTFYMNRCENARKAINHDKLQALVIKINNFNVLGLFLYI